VPPTVDSAPQGGGDRLLRFRLAVQKSRLAVFATAALLTLFAKLVGAVHVDYLTPGLLAGGACLSAVLFHEGYRRGLLRSPGLGADVVWIAIDVTCITWGVYLTGGANSPWFLWYLANASAVAFVAGEGWAVVVGTANAVAYLWVLGLMGEIRGWDDFWMAVIRMAFLYGASFFFLRGVARLREKERQLRGLREDERLKVDELIRITQDLDQGTRAMAEANIQIREADRVKGQFLANMSHELRTPLNSVIGFSEILLDRLSDQVSPKHLKFLDNIHSSGQHLLAIINDILDLSKVEAGKMEVHPESFRVLTAVDGVVAIMRGVTSKHPIEFEVDAPADLPPIETDPPKFKQVLYNLLSNAAKFSPQGSVVRVVVRHRSAAESPLRRDSLAVSVIDQGIGIAPADQELIFHEFRQADSTATRAFGGTGLGLALVRKFVELQGGQVGLESELGRGSTFSVTLPLRAVVGETAPEVTPEVPWNVASANRVLVVEDDMLAYQTLSRSLSAAGYFPIRARHGEEALEMARMLRPTVITLDLALPGMGGWDVLRELKKDAGTRSVPVVIVSMMDNRELGLALGADDYFVKPVDRDRLVARIRELARTTPPSVRPRLLLVDDDPMVHELLDAALGSLGFTVDHALSGVEGLAMAAKIRPDAIVLDLMMPDLNGFEVASALKEREATAHVPVLVLTAKDLTDHERQQLHGKIAALVQKGSNAATRLVDAIRELEGRHARDAVRGQAGE
jgi:signal transduction histidine kinase/DNA-binding response OmpR family regulator